MRLDAPQFKNKICQECIAKNFKKYGSFKIKCEGIQIEKNVKLAMSEGLSEEDARYLFDPVYFFNLIYGSPARDYQLAPLSCTAKSLISRQCRQTGKSLIYIYKIMQFVLTNSNKTVLIVAPQESQIKKLWDEYILRDCIERSPELSKSVISQAQKPNYQIKFDNGSKIVLMVAGPGVRSQTAHWIYIDEAATIPSETLNDIIMTVASKGEDAAILMTSTPKGRGNIFYKSCRNDPEFNEYHVRIYDVPIMTPLIQKFKRMLGETGFIQECEAEFPDISGGPFNFRGIELAKADYEYGYYRKDSSCIYIGGVDWNGPNVGSYMYVISFNPYTYEVTVVDNKVVSSAMWNSTVAKKAIVELNRKWNPAHWLCDAGYGHCMHFLTKIITDKGIKYLKDINIGDNVLTHDGSYQKVLRIFCPQKEKKVFEIKIKDHETIYASEDHSFLIKRATEEYPYWIKVKDICCKTDLFCSVNIYHKKEGSIKTDPYIYYSIEKIEFKEFSNNLLDLEVENTHSFTANGLICHNSMIEDLLLWSIKMEERDGPGHPDSMLKHTLEAVAFGDWVEVEDPFSKEKNKKTQKSFIISQVSRLFEPYNNQVKIKLSKYDNELIKALELYKIVNVTSKGVEQYGIDKKDGIADHCIDALALACYGIVKYYGELFKRIVYASSVFSAESVLKTPTEENINKKYVGSIVLLTDNNPETIMLDEKNIKDYSIDNSPIITRGLTSLLNRKKPFDRSRGSFNRSRDGVIKRSI